MRHLSTASGTRPAAPTRVDVKGHAAGAGDPADLRGSVWIVPISPLAAMIETSAVSSRIARATASGSTRPSASTPT